jgi:hypothetical protein
MLVSRSSHCCPQSRLKISARKYAVISDINRRRKVKNCLQERECDAQYIAENAGNVAKQKHERETKQLITSFSDI